VDRLPNQALRRPLEMGPQIGMDVGELPPHHRVEQAPRRLDHDRRAALARIPERPEPVAAAESDEQPRRPLVRHGELHLDRRIEAARLGELRLQPLGRGAGRLALARGRRAEEQRFNFPQSLAKLVLDRHAAAPRAARRHRAEPSSIRNKAPSTPLARSPRGVVVPVTESLAPGASVSKVAQRYGVNANLLFTWRRQEARAAANGDAESVKLLPVRVADAEAPAAARVTASSSAGPMEIMLPGGERIIVGADVDATALARVVRALTRR
jgi:transposase